LATFPNDYSHSRERRDSSPSQECPTAGTRWSSARSGSPLSELRRAVAEEDWERKYCEGLTKIHMCAEWMASPERCSLLQRLVHTNQVRRVLEVGSFCGAAALAMAEALPDDGEVHVIELDRYLVDFSRRFWMRSLHGRKIRHSVGAPLESLRLVAAEARSGILQPFDLAIVDADKDGMGKYFDLLWKSPGVLSKDAIVCVDMTPFKGQPPVRGMKYGFPHRWQGSSGQDEIDNLRNRVMSSAQFQAFEFGGLLFVQRT